MRPSAFLISTSGSDAINPRVTSQKSCVSANGNADAHDDWWAQVATVAPFGACLIASIAQLPRLASTGSPHPPPPPAGAPGPPPPRHATPAAATPTSRTTVSCLAWERAAQRGADAPLAAKNNCPGNWDATLALPPIVALPRSKSGGEASPSIIPTLAKSGRSHLL